MLLYASQSLSHSVSSMMTFLDVATMYDIVVVVFHELNTRCIHLKLCKLKIHIANIFNPQIYYVNILILLTLNFLMLIIQKQNQTNNVLSNQLLSTNQNELNRNFLVSYLDLSFYFRITCKQSQKRTILSPQEACFHMIPKQLILWLRSSRLLIYQELVFKVQGIYNIYNTKIH